MIDNGICPLRSNNIITTKSWEFLKENNSAIQNLMSSHGGSDESFQAFDIGESGLPYFRVYDREGNLAQVFKNDIDAGVAVSEDTVHDAVIKLLGK